MPRTEQDVGKNPIKGDSVITKANTVRTAHGFRGGNVQFTVDGGFTGGRTFTGDGTICETPPASWRRVIRAVLHIAQEDPHA